MSSPTPTHPQVSPRAAWYAVPIVLLVIAVTLFVIWIAQVVNVVSEEPVPIPASTMVTVSDDGVVIYSDGAAAGGVTCTAEPPSGNSVVFDAPDSAQPAPPDSSWDPVAVSPSDLAAGEYAISCRGAGNLQLASGPDPLSGIAAGILWGFILPAILGLTALVLLIVLPLKRGASKRSIEQHRLQQWHAYQYWSTEGREPPPGGPPPGRPGE